VTGARLHARFLTLGITSGQAGPQPGAGRGADAILARAHRRSGSARLAATAELAAQGPT
jgi:hypothetical protein